MKSRSILEKFHGKPRKNAKSKCYCVFNFLWRGQLESLNLDKIFLPLFKILPCSEVFLVT